MARALAPLFQPYDDDHSCFGIVMADFASTLPGYLTYVCHYDETALSLASAAKLPKFSALLKRISAVDPLTFPVR